MTILAIAKKTLPNPSARAGLNAVASESVKELERIIRRQAIRPVFQPIVSLADGGVIGYGALSRGPRGSRMERPDALFFAAAEGDLVWELEYLCRAKALEKAKDIVASKMLFINVDAKIVNDRRFQKGLTREMLDNYCVGAGNVVFEITEKTAISDYRSFCGILDNYKSQGYKIAIDDTGAGYSGLKTLAQTRPHYIKVDMDLVRDIDKDYIKQAMMKALHDISLITDSQIIAEGIETREELDILVRLGIPYGQGFFLQKPIPHFGEIRPGIRDIIIEVNRCRIGRLPRNRDTASGENLAGLWSDIPLEMRVGKALGYFSNHIRPCRMRI